MASEVSARSSGSHRSQFIASVRAAVRNVDTGGSPSAAIADIRQALKVLDKKSGNKKNG
ncbi:hypothetical protein LJR221_001499 [Agrobacterium tumefaciens]